MDELIDDIIRKAIEEVILNFVRMLLWKMFG